MRRSPIVIRVRLFVAVREGSVFVRRLIALILVCILCCPSVRGVETEKYVALTFDDGPSGRFTRRLLEGLQQRQVKATFLLCGYRLEQYPKLGQAIFDAGHEIGLHGYSHDNMATMRSYEVAQELRRNLELLPEGCKPVFLRPPGGCDSDVVVQAAKNAGLSILKWSVDPRDWANHDAAAVEAAVVDNVRDGDVILLHDMCDCSVEAAFAIIDRLQRQGFRFVTVSELAIIKGIGLTPGQIYSSFR